MFDSNDNAAQDQGVTDDGANPAADIFSGSSTPPVSTDGAPTDSTSSPFGAPVVPAADDSSPTATDNSPEPSVPAVVDTPAPIESEETKANEDSSTPASDEPDEDHDEVMTSSPSEDLSGMKQEALGHLQPLVAHLDLNPEEEFRTTMMMIQANDDQTLLKKAFEAAKKITDDKVRAQALLDVINEINYFTQHAE